MFHDQKSGWTWLKLDIDTTSFLIGGSMKRSAFKFIQVLGRIQCCNNKTEFFCFLASYHLGALLTSQKPLSGSCKWPKCNGVMNPSHA